MVTKVTREKYIAKEFNLGSVWLKIILIFVYLHFKELTLTCNIALNLLFSWLEEKIPLSQPKGFKTLNHS